MASHASILDLARSFPTLCHLEFLVGRTDDAMTRLREWALHSPSATSGGRYSAAFVLAVYQGQSDPEFPFDMVRAMNAWDSQHRRVFARWVADPFCA